MIFYPQIPIVQGDPNQLTPYAPNIVSISQAGGTVVVGIVPSSATGHFPIWRYVLRRSDDGGQSWAEISRRAPCPKAMETFALDAAPEIGTPVLYAVTAIDTQNAESPTSPSEPFSAWDSVPEILPANVPASDLGPYPILGSDAKLVKGELAVGANGDALSVNGLELLAQDLAIRLLTPKGTLPLHPSFGFAPTIGAGQGRVAVQRQILEADLREALASEPRVSKVISVRVVQGGSDGWVISYIVQAIGQEDPLKRNLVIPYARAA